jgi:hypothetical protein
MSTKSTHDTLNAFEATRDVWEKMTFGGLINSFTENK